MCILKAEREVLGKENKKSVIFKLKNDGATDSAELELSVFFPRSRRPERTSSLDWVV